ncbi:MAG: NeuD/PglB/VioB family sugar acetyltransferase, partial [Chlorobium sp.]
MKQKKLAILGASGHGKVVADAALNSGWEEVLFFDDAWPDVSAVGVWPVVGGTRELLEQASCFDGVVVAIGSNATRLEKQSLLEQAGVPIATIVHPSAIVSAYSDIGKGSVLFAGVVVNAFSTTGRACILNTSATVDHDCLLGDAVHVSPGAHLAGGVVVGQATWIG